MTATLSIAAQIAQDIREAIKPDFVPASIDRRLEAIIDANLAGERTKVAKLISAADRLLVGLAGESSPTCDHYDGIKEDAESELRAALFNLQA